MTLQLKRLTLLISRAAERRLPLDMLWFLLFPLAAVRAARDARVRSRGLPAIHLPVQPGYQSSYPDRFRYDLQANLERLRGGWSDRTAEPRWQRRIAVEGLDHLQRCLPGPVIFATVHVRYTSALTMFLRPWLGAQDIEIGYVAADMDWLNNAALRLRMEVSRRVRSVPFLPGQGREMVQYLTPGHCLLIAIDYPLGHLVDGTWAGGRLRLATGAFRLAHLTGARVVPMVALSTGRWRWRVLIGEPVPAELIADRKYEAAATWVAAQIMPEVARRPRQAVNWLVAAVLPAADASAASDNP